MEVKNKIKKIEFEATTEITLASGKKQTKVLKDYVYDTEDTELKFSLLDEIIKEGLDEIGIPLLDLDTSLKYFSLSDICNYTHVKTKYKETVKKDMPFIISSIINEEEKTEKINGKYETNTYYSYYKLAPSEVSCNDYVRDVLGSYMNLDNIEVYTSCGISAYLKTNVYRIFKDDTSQNISVTLPLKDIFRGNVKRAVETMLNELKDRLSDTFYKYKYRINTFNSSDTNIIDSILSIYKDEFTKKLNSIMYNKI